MIIYINKGDDLLSVEESVMTKITEMGAVEYADRTECKEVSDKIKYDLKITVTKTRRHRMGKGVR